MSRQMRCLNCGKTTKKQKPYCCETCCVTFRQKLAVAIRKEEQEGIDEDRWADDGGPVD